MKLVNITNLTFVTHESFSAKCLLPITWVTSETIWSDVPETANLQSTLSKQFNTCAILEEGRSRRPLHSSFLLDAVYSNYYCLSRIPATFNEFLFPRKSVFRDNGKTDKTFPEMKRLKLIFFKQCDAVSINVFP